MPPRGRPPKPAETKRALGNPGKRALPAASSLAVVPAVEVEPPELPPKDAMDAVLSAGKLWLAQTDAVALALLREALEEREALRAALLASQSRELRKDLRDLDKQIIGQLAQLGFDPAARSRLGLAEVKAKSKLQEMQERAAGRAG